MLTRRGAASGKEGCHGVNISQISCEKSHSNRNACSGNLDKFPNLFYEKRKQGCLVKAGAL